MRLTSLVLVLGAALAAGCKSPPTSLRVTLTVAPGESLPSSLRMSVFDPWGAVIDAHDFGQVALPGDVVVLVSPDADTVRVLAQGFTDDGSLLQAVERQKVQRGHETRIELLLSSRALADADLDGVPDAIDNCPVDVNPDQAASEGGPGDVCGGGPPPDLGPGLVGGNDDLGSTTPLEDASPSQPDLAEPVEPPTGDAVCGNGVVEDPEQCDDGDGNSDDPAAAATCTTACKRRASCGPLAGSLTAKVDPQNGHCYVTWDTPVNWATALRTCQSRGGHLATISSAAENDLIKTVAGTLDRWIGLTIQHDGQTALVRWVTSEPFTFLGFGPASPNDDNPTGEGCGVTSAASGGWDDKPCGFPRNGDLPNSSSAAFGYVCEHQCGNGVVEPGEGCDPPGPNCTATCQTKVACTEAGAFSSPINGHCYFTLPTAQTYAQARVACPAGTHLATLNDPAENEAGIKALGNNEAWIALRTLVTASGFAWEAPSPQPFDSRRFHGFISTTDDPNEGVGTQCVRATPTEGWRDRGCANLFVPLCERE